MQSSLHLMSLNKVQSSANTRVGDIRVELISLIYTRNNRGPRMDPCGTPEETVDQAEEWPSTRTLCWRFVRKALIRLSTLPRTPTLSSFMHSFLCGTVSNAFEKSRTIT